jgi:GT2 family glycosyltransferase
LNIAEASNAASRGEASRVAAILVNWNSWRDTVECLDSLLGQRYPALHVFIVDNDSADGSTAAIDAWCRTPQRMAGAPTHEGVDRHSRSRPGVPVGLRVARRDAGTLPEAGPGCAVTLVEAGANLGFAGGCNVGIAAAGPRDFDYYWLLNTDTVVHRDALAMLVCRARSDPGIGMVGSTILWYDRPRIVQCMGGARMDARTVDARHLGENTPIEELAQRAARVESELSYVMGASMLVSRDFVRDVGPMQEDYFLYFEEMDWAVRARGRFTLGYAPESHVFHKSGASSSDVVREFSTNLYYRNKLRFARRFFPERLAATRRVMVGELVKAALRGRWTMARIVASNLWGTALDRAIRPPSAPKTA